MASSLISSSHHVDFDSMFGMDDAALIQMFESLIATVLKDFLGCPAVFYEAALTEFFTNGSVREDGMVVSTIRDTTVEISEILFATAFDLPTEGLTDLSDVPKNLVFDARSLFSDSKEQESISCMKKELKIQYHLLHDILAKTIYVKAGSFDAVTRDRFMLMTAITCYVKVNWSNFLFNVLKEMVTPGSRQAKGFAIQICAILKTVPGLVLGESRVFPASRVLTEKTIHRYVAVNDKVGGEADTNAPRVKKTPVKKTVSHKRPAVDIETAPVVKKKRTTKGKHLKRKRRLILEDDFEVDEPVAGRSTAEHPVEEATTGVQEPDPESVEQPVVVPVLAPTTDDPDAVIKKVLNQLVLFSEQMMGNSPREPWLKRQWLLLKSHIGLISPMTILLPDGMLKDQWSLQVTLMKKKEPWMLMMGNRPQGTVVEETMVAAKEPHWFDLPYDDLIARWDAERPVVTASDTNEEEGTMDVGAAGGDQQVQFSVEEPEEIIKITMGKEIKIPGVDEKTHIDLLVHLRAQVIDAVDQFFHSFRFKKLATINIEEFFKKEEQFLCWGETETTHVALNRKRIWGCPAYVKQTVGDKLDTRPILCYFIGYPNNSIGYYFYYRSETKVFVSRNATFVEREFLLDRKGKIVELEKVRDPIEVPSESPAPPEPVPEMVAPRTSERVHRAPERYGFLLEDGQGDQVVGSDPRTFKEAISDADSNLWLEAMQSEFDSMHANQVWTLVNPPEGIVPIGCKWVYKRKLGPDGKLMTYKARLVAKGYTQRQGVDYDETFSPVGMFKSIRILLAIAAWYDYEIWQMDVKTMFLNGNIKEEIYITQPEGFTSIGSEHKVCKHQRSIYGLKQAS
ncbi:hypothetical protein F511_22245 [Dorcoceras hygrometricum]|uniref:Uncharacterized protein n=1 Tax=Dorcoceras hygrometricum TaxID=472368 RepID=A0A2Z7A6I7_9LAMI|nr:hypothetical protein F511_22245 [Dorcoceras hygrometricum]